MRLAELRLVAFVILLAMLSISIASQDVKVDLSACRGMHDVLKAMRDGAPRDKVLVILDRLLETRPYQVMFKHYNRSWRPNHLPKDVFKRMILSLAFKGEYSSGENERADAMLARWTEYYPDLSPYESRLSRLESANLPKLIKNGVRYAQSWLPAGWKIPDFYFPVIPNGGSPAFSLENTQGYDFLQLSREHPGDVDLDWLVGTVAHESHHLGMRSIMPGSMSPAEEMAYRVINLCVAEGVATEFISGPPEGRAPAVPNLPFHIFTPDLIRVWKERVEEEGSILEHQIALLAKAAAGNLTEEGLDAELREYWLSGAVGRAYVLGADIFGAIYLAFGKQAVFAVMEDPRKLFQIYNAALDAKPEPLRHCVRVPDAAVNQALAIGMGHAPISK